MKKILALVLCIAILSVLAATSVMASNLTLTAPKTTITIDGVKDDGYSDFYDIAFLEGNGATGKIAVAWDDN